MKLRAQVLGILLIGVGLIVGCRTPEEHAMDDLTRFVESQMNSARNKMQSAGMPEAGLRELDDVIHAMSDSMRQLEKEELKDSLHQFEKEMNRLERQMR